MAPRDEGLKRHGAVDGAAQRHWFGMSVQFRLNVQSAYDVRVGQVWGEGSPSTADILET
jgi:hypothetical protein